MSKNSYGQILKSSSLIGGAAGLNLLLAMVRVKFAAVLIGSVGMGLLANFTAIQGVIGTLAGLGINSSGVREVSAAVAKEDHQALSRTVLTLRRMCWLTGCVGMLVVVLLSPMLAQWTFGSQDNAHEIAALGLIILFSNISAGQTVLINGTRRIGDLARLNVISSVVGTVVTIGFYSWFGQKGIVPALVLSSAINLLVSWKYAKMVPVPSITMSWLESFREANGMIKLGFAMMWSGLLNSIAAYITIKLITADIGIHAVGLYSAAFSLSGMFVNFVLGAMGADYFPRLTGMTHDKEGMTRLVNEQTEIGLLMAAPGLLATLSLAPWLIYLFYTTEFLPAVPLLQWFICGCLVRVVSWPMGFVLLALSRGKLFFATETAFVLLNLALIVLSLSIFDLEAVAISFFIVNIVHATVIYLLVNNLIMFRLTSSARGLIVLAAAVFLAIFIAVRIMSLWQGTLICLMATVITSIYCMRALIIRIGIEHKISKLVLKLPYFSHLLNLKV